MRNIFSKKSYSKYSRKTRDKQFSRKSNRIYPRINSLNFSIACFYCMSKMRNTKIFWNCKLLTTIKTLAFTSFKVFKKNKNWSKTNLLDLFSVWFLAKFLSHVIFSKLTKFHCWLRLLLETLYNMCNVSICFPFYNVMNFEINLSFLNKPFFLHHQKC